MKAVTRYYSEILDKVFDSTEELEAAEKEKAQADEAAAKTTNRKKELANSVDEIENKIENAKKDYHSTVNDFDKKYKELKSEFLRKVNALEKERDETLEAERRKIKELEGDKYTAICTYNKEFGPYKKYLTGEDAEKEWRKVVDWAFDFTLPSLFDIFMN